MYIFILKDKGSDLDRMITRAMIALAAIAAILYHPEESNYLYNISAIVLLIGAAFSKLLMETFKINKFVLLFCAAVMLFLATRSISFSIILLVLGYLVKFLYHNSTIEITNTGVKIKKLLPSVVHEWGEFSNVILKDSLLTLDFKNNKLIQVSIDETKANIDENAFNIFCKGFIQTGQLA